MCFLAIPIKIVLFLNPYQTKSEITLLTSPMQCEATKKNVQKAIELSSINLSLRELKKLKLKDFKQRHFAQSQQLL